MKQDESLAEDHTNVQISTKSGNTNVKLSYKLEWKTRRDPSIFTNVQMCTEIIHWIKTSNEVFAGFSN